MNDVQFPYSTGLVVAVLCSCLLAYGVNLSTYLVIGHTSPVSYQVGAGILSAIYVCL